jgi:hypothetical protein
LVTGHITDSRRAHFCIARSRLTGERGTVTAEAALVLPVIAAFVLALMWLLTIGIAKVQTVDAARDAARVFTRGDGTAAAVAAARQSAPRDAQVEVTSSSSGSVTVTVTLAMAAPSWLLVPLPGVTVGSTATTPLEASDVAP